MNRQTMTSYTRCTMTTNTCCTMTCCTMTRYTRCTAKIAATQGSWARGAGTCCLAVSYVRGQALQAYHSTVSLDAVEDRSTCGAPLPHLVKVHKELLEPDALLVNHLSALQRS